jgi:hypothetical protein
VKLSQVLEPVGFASKSSPGSQHPYNGTPFPATLSSPSHLSVDICFETALYEQSTISAITFYDFPSWWSVSMKVSCITVRSDVFSMIVTKNK